MDRPYRTNGEEGNAYRVFVAKQQERDHYEGQDVDE
jgi:hypothetical protein